MNRRSGMHVTILATLVAGLVALASVAGGEVTKLDKVELAQTPTSTTYTINPSGVVQYQEYTMTEPSRLVIDLVGVRNLVEPQTLTADGKFVTAIRASQFKSEPDLVTRVVFELADGTHYKVTRKGTALEVSFSQKAEVMGASLFGDAPAPAPAPSSASTTPAANPAPAADSVAEAKTPPAQPSEAAPAAAATKPAEPAPQPAADEWQAQPATQDDVSNAWPAPSENEAVPAKDDIAMARNTNRVAAEMSTPLYGSTLSNQAMTIDVQGADIKTVLRSVSEFSGVNIIAGPEVEGAVVIHLKNVPWKEALDTILKSQGYGWRESYGIIRVAPIDQLQDDEVKAVTVERKKEEMASLQTRVVKLNFLNAKEIKTAMSKMTSPRGSVEAEPGTNSVVIAEVPARIDKMVSMIEEMDQRLRQVEIVAKMVDVDHEATRELGVNWEALNLHAGDFAGDIVTGQALADPFGKLRVGTVQSWGDLNLIIEALEKDNKANIVSNPRISTADNQEARIMVGKEIPLIVSDEAGNPITELKKIGVILRVTPHVNSDGTITMDLHPELSDLAQQATVQGGVIVNLQEADTRVVVKDGETAVIGGLISDTESSLRSGVPVLKDVPLLGGLFRYESKSTRKRELIIFVTPKVVG
jgi:type II secretory pathway component GspD/PulD (secretin)